MALKRAFLVLKYYGWTNSVDPYLFKLRKTKFGEYWESNTIVRYLSLEDMVALKRAVLFV